MKTYFISYHDEKKGFGSTVIMTDADTISVEVLGRWLVRLENELMLHRLTILFFTEIAEREEQPA